MNDGNDGNDGKTVEKIYAEINAISKIRDLLHSQVMERYEMINNILGIKVNHLSLKEEACKE